jgi:hypothetical protein
MPTFCRLSHTSPASFYLFQFVVLSWPRARWTARDLSRIMDSMPQMNRMGYWMVACGVAPQRGTLSPVPPGIRPK